MYFCSAFSNVCNPMKQTKYFRVKDWQLGEISMKDSHKAQEEKTVAYRGEGMLSPKNTTSKNTIR